PGGAGQAPACLGSRTAGMKKLTALVLVFTLIPAAGAAATTLEEILERSRDAVYSGEQLISCATPDGYRGVLTSIKQRGSSINITALTDTSSEVAIGPGVLVRRMGDAGVVEETKVGGGVVEVATLYEVEDLGGRFFIGREASAYRLTREGMLRGELVLDNETGALIRMTSFDN